MSSQVQKINLNDLINAVSPYYEMSDSIQVWEKNDSLVKYIKRKLKLLNTEELREIKKGLNSWGSLIVTSYFPELI